jgi:hypothetical protein
MREGNQPPSSNAKLKSCGVIPPFPIRIVGMVLNLTQEQLHFHVGRYKLRRRRPACSNSFRKFPELVYYIEINILTSIYTTFPSK